MFCIVLPWERAVGSRQVEKLAQRLPPFLSAVSQDLMRSKELAERFVVLKEPLFELRIISVVTVAENCGSEGVAIHDRASEGWIEPPNG